MDDNTKTTLGLSENIEALLCYIVGWVTGLIFLVLEKENSFVRFHAVQSAATFLLLFILSIFASFIPIVGPIIQILIRPVSLILWLWLMYKAYNGEKYKLPLIGNWAEQKVERIKFL